MDTYRLGSPFIAGAGLCSVAGGAPGNAKERQATIVSHLMMTGASAESVLEAFRMAVPDAASLGDVEKQFIHIEDVARRVHDLLKSQLTHDQLEALALGFDVAILGGACGGLRSATIPDVEPPDDPPSDIVDVALGLAFIVFQIAADTKSHGHTVSVLTDLMRRRMDTASRHTSALGLDWIDFAPLRNLVDRCASRGEFAPLLPRVREAGKVIVEGLVAKG